METWLVWAVAGFVLVIAELVSGTFYLLVVGVGAFAGALAAWLGAGLVVQALVSGLVSVVGAWLVHTWHARQPVTAQGSNFLDRGQPVVLEGWANETASIARVKYRGSTWEARLAQPGERPAPGTTLYIEGQDGNTLLVAAAPPAH
ncbi:MAG TPA: NfeD family protein [Usitatibacter sp.]|nr:NfeD family protein [Usitatibacter sp.]